MTELNQDLHRKRETLLSILAEAGKVAVAFSGGVDSTVVAQAAQQACGDEAVAVTAVTPSLATGEKEEAERLARQIGIRHRFIETEEFNDPNYVRNAPNRCFFCKQELYTQVERLQPELGVDAVLNGANLDDQGDHRPGMQAAHQHAVRSPLIEAGLTKDEVRQLARYWELPVWDKPASPCLSSRIAYGVEVTPERVQRVDQAEQFLRNEFALREFRVRHEAGDLARIEVPTEEIPRLVEPAARRQILEHLQSLGFQYVTVDLAGFRSGSMNAVLPVESLQKMSE